MLVDGLPETAPVQDLAWFGGIGQCFFQGVYSGGAVLKKLITAFEVFFGVFLVVIGLVPGKPEFFRMENVVNNFVAGGGVVFRGIIPGNTLQVS